MLYIHLNIKGGVGKTTSSINLAAGLSTTRRVLLIDEDPQHSATKTLLGRVLSDDEKSIEDAMNNPKCTKECIQRTGLSSMDILPSKLSLFAFEKRIMLDTTSPQHSKLFRVIKEVENDYDDIIVDCSPSLNTLALNAVYACKNGRGKVIIPVKIDLGAEEGCDITVDFIHEVNQGYDLDIDYCVLITMLNRNLTDVKVMNEIYEKVGGKMFDAKIRYQGKPVTDAAYANEAVIFNDSKNVGKDYQSWVNEVKTWQACHVGK